MNELSCSKYCMLTVMSYIDYSHIVNREILRKLNQRFRNFSLDKAEDGLNMLPKATVTYKKQAILKLVILLYTQR